MMVSNASEPQINVGIQFSLKNWGKRMNSEGGQTETRKAIFAWRIYGKRRKDRGHDPAE